MSDGVNIDLASLIRLRFSATKLNLFSTQKTQTQQAGIKRAIHLGRGMDFAEVRPYQAGDDVRHINWQLTARTGKPYSKIYQEERERPIYLVVDQSSSMHFATRTMFKSVLAAKLAALFAWAGLKHNDQIGGIVFNDQDTQWLHPKRQRKTVLQFLNTIVKLNQQVPSNTDNHLLTPSLQKLKAEMTSGSVVIVISDFMGLDSAAERLLLSMSRYNTVLCVFTYDVIENHAPKNNVFMFTDGEQRLAFDGLSKQYITAYQNLFAERLALLENLANKSHLRLLTVPTNADLISILNKVRL
jgi:uncharacterized protein (DUF58 family)